MVQVCYFCFWARSFNVLRWYLLTGMQQRRWCAWSAYRCSLWLLSVALRHATASLWLGISVIFASSSTMTIGIYYTHLLAFDVCGVESVGLGWSQPTFFYWFVFKKLRKGNNTSLSKYHLFIYTINLEQCTFLGHSIYISKMKIFVDKLTCWFVICWPDLLTIF